MDSPYYFDIKVNVGSFSFVGFGELAPLLDELNKRHNAVRATVHDFEPPAAGFSEIAITIAVSGVALYLKSFLETWAAEDAKALRGKMLKAMQRAQENTYGRRFVPLRIEIGALRFYFHAIVNDDELAKRLRAAQHLAVSVPESLLAESPGPGEYGHYWDSSTNSWRGSIYNVGGEICLPENVLTDRPGDLICHEPRSRRDLG